MNQKREHAFKAVASKAVVLEAVVSDAVVFEVVVFAAAVFVAAVLETVTFDTITSPGINPSKILVDAFSAAAVALSPTRRSRRAHTSKNGKRKRQGRAPRNKKQTACGAALFRIGSATAKPALECLKTGPSSRFFSEFRCRLQEENKQVQTVEVKVGVIVLVWV